MAKKKKKSSRRVLLVCIVAMLALFAFILTFKNPAPKQEKAVNPISKYNSSIVSLYQSDNIFGSISPKKRQMSSNVKSLGFFQNDSDSVVELFQKEVQNELSSFNDSQLMSMRCMPEQIYQNRYNMRFSFIEPQGNYKKVEIKDQEMLQLFSTLESSLNPEYTISQFIACKTPDNKFIVKYNPIIKGGETNGFDDRTNIRAFFAEVLPTGQVIELAYIPLKFNSYCRYPVQLTNTGEFYFACNAYRGNSTMEPPYGSYLYRVNINTLKYTLLSSCEFLSGKQACY